MNTYFKEGDTVYCALYGKGVVESINLSNKFPITVIFKSSAEDYTLDGRFTNESNIVLSQNPIPKITNRVIDEFKKFEIVEVSDDYINWNIRYYITKDDDDNYVACSNKEKEEHFARWNYCRKI